MGDEDCACTQSELDRPLVEESSPGSSASSVGSMTLQNPQDKSVSDDSCE